MDPANLRTISDRIPPVGRIVGASDVKLWGMTSVERIRRAFHRAGVAETAGEGPADAAIQVLVRGDYVLDETLIKDLASKPQTLLVASDGRTPVAAHCDRCTAKKLIQALSGAEPLPADVATTLQLVRPAELSGIYRGSLRKRETPWVLPLTVADRPKIERRMFAGSYKGVTDLVTKYVWPEPAFWATRWAAAAHVPPNVVTLLGLLLVLAAFWLFLHGAFGAGLAAAWLMTFLDTVDGKLARVTLTSTKFGDVLDHGVDLVHPPFWYFAWVVGLESVGLPLANATALLAIVIGGYILGRLQEALFLSKFGIQMHIWRPIDSRFRLITARRNPNLLILTLFTIAGRPDLGMLAVAAWTCVSLVFHSVRIIQAFRVRGTGRLTSWLATAP